MASITSSCIAVPLLNKQKMAQLSAQAKGLGLTPERYAKRIIESALAVQRDAERMSFAQIMAPVRKASGGVDEAEIVDLVRQARRKSGRAGRRDSKR